MHSAPSVSIPKSLVTAISSRGFARMTRISNRFVCLARSALIRGQNCCPCRCPRVPCFPLFPLGKRLGSLTRDRNTLPRKQLRRLAGGREAFQNLKKGSATLGPHIHVVVHAEGMTNNRRRWSAVRTNEPVERSDTHRFLHRLRRANAISQLLTEGLRPPATV